MANMNWERVGIYTITSGYQQVNFPVPRGTSEIFLYLKATTNLPAVSYYLKDLVTNILVTTEDEKVIDADLNILKELGQYVFGTYDDPQTTTNSGDTTEGTFVIPVGDAKNKFRIPVDSHGALTVQFDTGDLASVSVEIYANTVANAPYGYISKRQFTYNVPGSGDLETILRGDISAASFLLKWGPGVKRFRITGPINIPDVPVKMLNDLTRFYSDFEISGNSFLADVRGRGFGLFGSEAPLSIEAEASASDTIDILVLSSERIRVVPNVSTEPISRPLKPIKEVRRPLLPGSPSGGELKPLG